MNNMVRLGAEGVFNSVALKPRPDYDIYCPVMDINHFKSPWRLNYFGESCSDRLTDGLCPYKGECEHSEGSKKS